MPMLSGSAIAAKDYVPLQDATVVPELSEEEREDARERTSVTAYVVHEAIRLDGAEELRRSSSAFSYSLLFRNRNVHCLSVIHSQKPSRIVGGVYHCATIRYACSALLRNPYSQLRMNALDEAVSRQPSNARKEPAIQDVAWRARFRIIDLIHDVRLRNSAG